MIHTLGRLLKGGPPGTSIKATYRAADQHWGQVFAGVDWSDVVAVAHAVTEQRYHFCAAYDAEYAAELMAWIALGHFRDPAGEWADLERARQVYRVLSNHPHLDINVRAEADPVARLCPELRG